MLRIAVDVAGYFPEMLRQQKVPFHLGGALYLFSFGVRAFRRNGTFMSFNLLEYAVMCNIHAPEEFCARAVRLRDIVLEANKKFNLTRITSADEFMIKHVADSLAIGRYFPDEIRNARTVADLGCGGGFPTLVLALAYPHLEVTGIDSTGKKVKFVRDAADELGLDNVRTIHARVEELNRKDEFKHKFDIVTARAVAPGSVLAKYASNFPSHNGRFIFYKTPKQAEEDLQFLDWELSQPYELPMEMGSRIFLCSKSKKVFTKQ